MTVEPVLTFADVIIVPGKAPVEPGMVRLETSITRSHRVDIPLLSSPMDTVTEVRLAVLLARIGAVGVIHRNMTAEEEAEMVRRVKSADPSPESEVPLVSSLEEAIEAVKNGVPAVLLKGGERAIVLPEGSDYQTLGVKAELLYQLLDQGVRPSVDEQGRLLVGAAVSPFDVNRAVMLEKAGVDFLVIDVAHLHNVNALEALKNLRRNVGVEIIAGNIGTKEAVLDVIQALDGEVGGLRVGISSGSICSTGVVAGASMPTLTAVIQARLALEELGLHGSIPIIADGGVRGPGDAAKALIAGASAVMAGRMLAGTLESAAPIVRLEKGRFKVYRGMASRGAMERRYASDRYSRPSKRLEEGVEGLVPFEGSAVRVVAHLYFGLQAALGYAGAGSIREAWEKARLAKVTPIGLQEIKPHDIILT
ncbi:MAG: IMP dehydrogenase [Desulfurococcales archaeon]|nr:IMP dehydrogenase [Desulfurococcales archaeon]